MKRAARFTCVLVLGIVIGFFANYGLSYIGVNFRILPHSLNGHTIVDPDRGIHADRVERIFAQFAHEVRLPASSKSVHAALNAAWLKQEMIHGIYVLGGWIPVNSGGDTTAFEINLASPADDLTGQIYVAISGAESASEALEFLTGKGKDDWRLKEFALCYPRHPGEVVGRIEMFRWWGVRVSQW